ncbi:MAG: DUF790 family protein [bacterium]
MLTNDLLRFKIDERAIIPRYLTRRHAGTYLKIAQDLIHIYQNHVGKTRRALEQALDDYEQNRVGYKIQRGLTKILDGFVEFQPKLEFDFPEFRKNLFEFVEKYRPVVRQADLVHQNTKNFVLKKFAKELKPLPHFLYGDLPDHHVLVKIKRRIEPDELLRRYNMALAQGILYRCYQMEVKIWDSYKTVFHYLKLAQLMHKIGKAGEAYQIIVDGPLSLFKRTQKYGVNLARFLPGLLLAQKWQMNALVNTEKGQRSFFLNQDCGLTSHYKKEDPFDSTVEEAFYNGFKRRNTEWDIERECEIVDLGNTVFIPDFKLIHPDGCNMLLEIVGFWTPEYLNKKLEKLKQANRKDLIVAVNEKLNCSKSDFIGPVIYFKTRLKVSVVLNLLKEIFSN